jgi:glycosyltransferase involved in cell wall biosynthesis
MNILFVSPPPYLPNRLHRIRSYLLIQALAKKHTIHLFALTTEKNESEDFKNLQTYCKSVTIVRKNKWLAILQCFFYPFLPAEVAYCISQPAKNKIERIIRSKKISLIYAKRLRSVAFLPQTRIPIIIDTTDAMSMFYLRMHEHTGIGIKKIFYLLEFLRYRSYEKKMMDKMTHWITCSETDKKYLEKIKKHHNLRIDVIPNAVDTEYFRPKNKKILYTLLFRGLLDKPVNVDAVIFFVKKIFPLIKTQFPMSSLCIAGAKPIQKIRKLDDGKNIFLKPDIINMQEAIAQSRITVCPVRIGSGTRHKILQSWAMQKPIVSTTIGAEGLRYIDKKNILIADTPAKFAHAVCLLLKNKSLYDRIRLKGYETVQNNYSLSVIEKQLTKILLSYGK